MNEMLALYVNKNDFKQFFYRKYYDLDFRDNDDYERGFNDAFKAGCLMAKKLMEANNRGNNISVKNSSKKNKNY